MIESQAFERGNEKHVLTEMRCHHSRICQSDGLLSIPIHLGQSLARPRLAALPRSCDSPLAQESAEVQTLPRAGVDNYLSSGTAADEPDTAL